MISCVASAAGSGSKEYVMSLSEQSVWRHGNQYSADSACAHCEGIVFTKPVQLENARVRYAFERASPRSPDDSPSRVRLRRAERALDRSGPLCKTAARKKRKNGDQKGKQNLTPAALLVEGNLTSNQHLRWREHLHRPLGAVANQAIHHYDAYRLRVTSDPKTDKLLKRYTVCHEVGDCRNGGPH